MAPSRRRGASKASAAAAAAACRRWKVGDLVLAKLKGFPAWPATVSEPEKWGYTTDWKKVLVYFFGTQQIAFCNPTDVEAFTEEKKQTLLSKRHGKGSDFVRAVHEIIDSFDKLKKEDNKDIDVIQSSNQVTVTLTNTTQCVQSFADDNLGFNGDLPAPKPKPYPKTSVPINFHTDDAVPEKSDVGESPISNTYSRKKASATKTVTQKRAPSVRRSRSSSRTEPNRFQNFILPSNKIENSEGSLESSRRSKRVRRSPSDAPEVHNTESQSLVSNICLEEVRVDSETHSLNDGSTVESVECCEGDVELSQQLDFIVKKKRKPSRKRSCNGGPEITGAVTEVHEKIEESIGSDFEKSNGHYSKEDGDEHLPLVKRARVRMSRSTVEDEIEDTSIKVSVDCISENPVVNISPVSKPPSMIWEVTKQQNSANSVDVEAALPPSKRLHRALEAMSANAAERGQTSSEAPPPTAKLSNGHCSSPENLDALNPSIMEETANLLVGLATCEEPVEVDTSRNHENFSDEAVNNHAPSLDTHVEEIQIVVAQSPKPLSPKPVECNQSSLDCSTVPQNETETEQITQLTSPCKKDENVEELSRMSSEPSVEIPSDSRQIDANSNCKTIEVSTPPHAHYTLESEMTNIIEEIKPDLKDSKATPSSITEEVARAAVQEAQIPNSPSHSDDCKEAVPGTARSSSSPTEGLDSKSASTPPNTTLVDNNSNSNVLEENNGSSSSDARLQYDVPKNTAGSAEDEADVALTSFETNLGTVRRTKESISKATRIAIDCAKHGIASKAMDAIVRHLECEPSLHRRIDLFFLVDSITQWSRSSKGDFGGVYLSLTQARLPRLLLAAAPPGGSALENRKQCLKVLKLWQDRGILPESVMRRHIRELEALTTSVNAGVFTARRQSRTERAFDDPLREMEGMVDEYGSNSSYQLPGFCMPPMVKDGEEEDDNGGSDSDEGDFESVTPEHNNNNISENNSIEEWAQDCTPVRTNEKRSHILEDVDGELEMEDVAPPPPSFEEQLPLVSCSYINQLPQQHYLPPFVPPPPPNDVPPSSPPLPTSPPPPPPPPHLPPPLLPHDSSLYAPIQNIKDDQTIHYPIPPPPPPPPPPESRDPQCSMHGANMLHKPFHLPPPHPAPSNQFSYVQAEPPQLQSYPPHQFHYLAKTDNTGGYYNDHHLAPHDENWRYSAPISGPCYPENNGLHYGYGEGIPSHSWSFPPQPMNHREPIPHRPPSEAPIPAAVRAPNYWQPR
jgi:hypothetical protein